MKARIRRFRDEDRSVVWTLSQIPHIGATADLSAPLDLPPRSDPGPWGDLWDVRASWIDAGGDFLVCEVESRVVAMGGVMPEGDARAKVDHIRVHPALRRVGLGRMVMDSIECRAVELGCTRTYLDTTVEQPEAVAFYRALGYVEVGREKHPDWELVFFTKDLALLRQAADGSARTLGADGRRER